MTIVVVDITSDLVLSSSHNSSQELSQEIAEQTNLSFSNLTDCVVIEQMEPTGIEVGDSVGGGILYTTPDSRVFKATDSRILHIMQ
jgi:hypothetical protein